MGGVFSRTGAVISAKINALLGRSKDLAETLDYAYERQLDQLHKVKPGIVEVVTSKRRLEMQATKLESNEAKLTEQAQRAIQAGREDLAHIALQRKQLVVTHRQKACGANSRLGGGSGAAGAHRTKAGSQGGEFPHPQECQQGPVQRGRGANTDQ